MKSQSKTEQNHRKDASPSATRLREVLDCDEMVRVDAVVLSRPGWARSKMGVAHVLSRDVERDVRQVGAPFEAMVATSNLDPACPVSFAASHQSIVRQSSNNQSAIQPSLGGWDFTKFLVMGALHPTLAWESNP